MGRSSRKKSLSQPRKSASATRLDQGAPARTPFIQQPDAESTHARLAPALRVWLAVGLIAVAGAAAYANSLDGAFVFDDTDSIKNNPNIRSLTPLTQALRTRGDETSTATGRPIVCLTLAINHAAGGLEPRGYHVFNITMHVLTALALFGVLRRALLESRPAWALWFPLTVALLWVVHPLNTDALNHVIYRTEIMMGWCYLMVLYCVLRGARSPSCTALWYGSAVLFTMLGMGCKENMISVPVAALLLDRAVLSKSWAEVLGRWRLYAILMVTALIGLSFSRWSGIRHDAVGTNQTEFTLVRYLLVQSVVLVHYIRLALWPQPLIFDYHEWPDPYAFGEVWMHSAAILILIAVLVWLWIRKPAWALPWIIGWFILAPTSLIPNAGERIGEHRMYLPLAAVVITIVAGLYWASAAAVGRLGLPAPAARLGRVLGVATAVVALGLATLDRNTVYASEQSLWADVVAKRPQNARAWCGLAESKYHQALLTADATKARPLFEEAVADFEKSLELEPEDSETHLNIGKIYHEHLGREPVNRTRAMDSYREALRLNPAYVEAHTNLANLLMQQFEGRRSEAIVHYRAALKQRPYFVNALYGYGQVLALEGDYDGAEQAYLTALSRPSLHSTQVRYLLAGLYRKTGRMEDALEQYLQLLQDHPQDANLHYAAASVYERLGRAAEARQHLRQVLDIQPNHPFAQQKLDELGS